MTKFRFSKKWCVAKAKLEDGIPISAGVSDSAAAPDYSNWTLDDYRAEANSWKNRRKALIHAFVSLGLPATDRIPKALALVKAELMEAAKHFKPHASAHESYAVLLEEVDELKAEVWKRQGSRDYEAMAKEAVQVAAMALRFLTDICFAHPMSRDGEALIPGGPKETRFFSKRPLSKAEIAYGQKLAKEIEQRQLDKRLKRNLAKHAAKKQKRRMEHLKALRYVRSLEKRKFAAVARIAKRKSRRGKRTT